MCKHFSTKWHFTTHTPIPHFSTMPTSMSLIGALPSGNPSLLNLFFMVCGENSLGKKVEFFYFMIGVGREKKNCFFGLVTYLELEFLGLVTYTWKLVFLAWLLEFGIKLFQFFYIYFKRLNHRVRSRVHRRMRKWNSQQIVWGFFQIQFVIKCLFVHLGGKSESWWNWYQGACASVACWCNHWTSGKQNQRISRADAMSFQSVPRVLSGVQRSSLLYGFSLKIIDHQVNAMQLL